MCGITGVYNLDERKADPILLKSMTDCLRHRGPDDSGIYVDQNVGLGHARLSILDLSPAGHQPMSNDDQTIWVTFNGEIYNFQEIRKELEQKGYKFKSNSDTEVIIKSYEEWGLKAVEKYRGMFAFAIWDNALKKLFIARDQLGIKPLYWFFNQVDGLSVFGFASEIKAIIKHPDYKMGVDLGALNEYFTFQNLFSYRTLFKDVILLPQANTVKIEANSIGVKHISWWDYNFSIGKTKK